MKYLKILGLAAIAAAALMAFAGSASATILTGTGCASTGCAKGTIIHATSEGHAVLDAGAGPIECNSTVEGKTSNAGGASETVEGPISILNFTGCTNGVVVTVNKPGKLEIHTRTASADNNGTLTSTGAEVTVVAFGLECIYKTNGTDIGTLTGGTTATLDIEATLPNSGNPFCGSTAKWTGSYKVDTPDTLIVD